MATHTLSTNRSTTWKVTGSNGTWTVKAGVKIEPNAGPGILEGAASHDNKINLNGNISNSGPSAAAVEILGTNTLVMVGKSAYIHATYGIIGTDLDPNYAVGMKLVNHGTITASQYGAYLGLSGRLDNDGTITGFNAVSVGGVNANIVNRAAGVLNGGEAAIDSTVSGITTVTNHGILSAAGHAIQDEGGSLRLVNDGKIYGDILLGDGNDRVDSRGGTISGVMEGGKGDDTFTIDKTGFIITELSGEGMDTVKSSADYSLSAHIEVLLLTGTANIDGDGNQNDNLLKGNSGSNNLFGYGGEDRLYGGKGNDHLTGGGAADHFVFNPGDKVDTITDFQNTFDKIEILGFAAVTDFATLGPKLSQVGSDVQIDLGAGDRLLIKGTLLSDLDASDFVFV